MTFIVNPSHYLPVVRQIAAVKIFLAVLAMIAGSMHVSAQSAASTPVPSPSPASTPETKSAPTETKLREVKTSTGTVVVPPEKSEPVRITRFEKVPVIDGKLDDDVWKQAVVLKDFYDIDPGDNLPAQKKTEVMLGYDPKFLYIAFHCYDEPDKVRATVARRDNIFSDDYVGFFLDTFNDQRKAFEAFFNPLGIQGDATFTEGRGEDFSVDVVMQSKGMVTSDGWIVEVAIPFKSIRYTAGKGKLWGAHFFRRIKRLNNELDSWMPVSKSISGTLNQAGHLTGLEGISTERTLEIIPSVTLSETGRLVRSYGVFPGTPAALVDPGRIVNEPAKLDVGVTAKFGLTPTVTLDLAVNPDFAQVEADQLVVTTNQRFPIFFSEKRPFFLEGIDIFQTPILAVHTRTIVDPDIAVKLSGKQGKTTFGIMGASDNGPGNLSADDRGALASCIERRSFNSNVVCNNERFVDKNAYIGVLRLKRDIGKSDSTIGVIATTYNFIEKHNELGGFDGRFRVNKKTTAFIQVLGTTSRNFFFDPFQGKSIYRTGNGFAYSGDYNFSGRHWGYEVYGEGYTHDYRADVGFFGRTDTNFNSFFIRHNTTQNPKKKIISRHIHNFSWIGYDFQGRIQNWESENYIEWRLPRNSYFSLAWEPAYERVLEEEFGTSRNAVCINNPDPTKRCRAAFYGPDDERSVHKNHFFIAGSSQFNKKIQFNGRAVWRVNHLDLDFGGGRRFPRVSPPAIRSRELIATGQCAPPAVGQPDLRDPLCFGAPLDPGAGNLFEFSGGVTYQPTNELRMQLNYVKNRLVRKDTGLVAFDTNIFTLRTTYQFTKYSFARAIIDYNTLNQRVRAQFLYGWTPNPGTAFYAGYNDDLNYGFNAISSSIIPGFRRNGRTFFVKMSYLFRKSF